MPEGSGAETSEREPAAEPFFAEPAPEEPQRVFHRVFDRPRDPEPSASTPDADAPRSDDHEPSQS